MRKITAEEHTFLMPAIDLVTIDEYLSTSYEPDCDFIEGHLEDRNTGEYDHSRIQCKVAVCFFSVEAATDTFTLIASRLQVAPDRIRVPDVMVVRKAQLADRIIRTPPFVCIEVISPKDKWSRMRIRFNDYLAMGVEHVLTFDPDAREARRYTAAGFFVVSGPTLTIPGTPISIDLAEVFSALE